MALPDDSPFSPEEWQTCLKVLQVLSRHPDAAPETEVLKGLVTKVYRQARKSIRRENHQERAAADRSVREQTLLCRDEPLVPQLAVALPETAQHGIASVLKRPIQCYVCKEPYHQVHFFYHLLCPDCARFNYERRTQRADLTGRIALITGGRIKIGYQTALKLLRDGARVMVTTRFARDAARRYAAEPDFSEWQDRLQIVRLDLRNIPAVEAWVQHLHSTLPHLDILINNAAQTICRPPAFYQHLLATENEPLLHLPAHEQKLLVNEQETPPYTLANPPEVPAEWQAYFPQGLLDRHGQQADFRPENSWRLGLEQVETVELMEVQLVNAVAPFLLNGKLKPLLLQSPFQRRFIINVSAMEGQFNRESKTHFHPHTNMAKAALNMMTRTSAAEYARWGIYMNSVDTGWITDEDPHPRKIHKRAKGFVPPLDETDGAARLYDPIVRGIVDAEEPLFGHFLKDYRPYPW